MCVFLIPPPLPGVPLSQVPIVPAYILSSPTLEGVTPGMGFKHISPSPCYPWCMQIGPGAWSKPINWETWQQVPRPQGRHNILAQFHSWVQHYFYLQTSLDWNHTLVLLGRDLPILKWYYLSLWLALFQIKTLLEDKTARIELGEYQPKYFFKSSSMYLFGPLHV